MKMKMLTLRCLSPLALAVACLGAQAQTADSSFSFSGFATVGAVGTNSDAGQYVIYGQPRGADKRWSGEVDSKLGLQLTAKGDKVFSGTVQVLTKQNGDGRYMPQLDSAFVKAQVMPSLAFRGGPQGGPFLRGVRLP